MDGIRDDLGGKMEDTMFFGKEEHTRLVIDEDSVYEIDLDCMNCRKKAYVGYEQTNNA